MKSKKSFGVTLALSIFCAGTGFNRMYVGRVGDGFIVLFINVFTLGLLALLFALFDVIMLVAGRFVDKDGLTV